MSSSVRGVTPRARTRKAAAGAPSKARSSAARTTSGQGKASTKSAKPSGAKPPKTSTKAPEASATKAGGGARAKASRADRPAPAQATGGGPALADVVLRGAEFYFPDSGQSVSSLIEREHPHRVFMLRERRRMGAKYVRTAGPDETPSMMATAAAQKLLTKLGVDPTTLDMVITAGCTPPDFDVWSMPAKVAANLGATRAECFGFGEAACACAFAAIRTLVPLMRMPDGPARVLLVAGCVTPGGHFFPPVTIYGDGGGAILLERVPAGVDASTLGPRIVRAEYHTNARFIDAFGTAAGISRLRSEGKLEPADWTVRVKDSTVIDELIDGSTGRGAELVRKALIKQGWTPQDLRWLILDNVAAIMPIDMAAMLGVPEDRVLLENVVRYGHAWVVDIFVNLATILGERPLERGQRMACAGIGQGEHWGVMLVEA